MKLDRFVYLICMDVKIISQFIALTKLEKTHTLFFILRNRIETDINKIIDWFIGSHCRNKIRKNDQLLFSFYQRLCEQIKQMSLLRFYEN